MAWASLKLALNPDFSQFDVDQDVLWLDTEERFIPERRQFFLDSQQLFISPINLFFSRRIAPSQLTDRVWGGAQLTSKKNGFAWRCSTPRARRCTPTALRRRQRRGGEAQAGPRPALAGVAAGPEPRATRRTGCSAWTPTSSSSRSGSSRPRRPRRGARTPSFDLVFCEGDLVSYCLDEHPRVLKELLRVAAPGAGMDNRHEHFRGGALHRKGQGARARRAAHEPVRLPHGLPVHAFTEPELRQAVEAAGGEVVEIFGRPGLRRVGGTRGTRRVPPAAGAPGQLRWGRPLPGDGAPPGTCPCPRCPTSASASATAGSSTPSSPAPRELARCERLRLTLA